MPKDKRVCSLSSGRSRVSPYPVIRNRAEQCKPQGPLGSSEDCKEWEEVICPICMEPPHNTVLLKCSSHEKGCRPYVCNTSHRHSNCLDQLCKSVTASPSTIQLQNVSSSRTMSEGGYEQEFQGYMRPDASHLNLKLACPLCRGAIYGWVVVEHARKFFDSKPRSCSCEACDFSGTYAELRKHARSEHPSVRPAEVNPERQHEWMRREEEQNFADSFGAVGWSYEDIEENDNIIDDNVFDLFEDLFTGFTLTTMELLVEYLETPMPLEPIESVSESVWRTSSYVEPAPVVRSNNSTANNGFRTSQPHRRSQGNNGQLHYRTSERLSGARHNRDSSSAFTRETTRNARQLRWRRDQR